MKKGILSWVQQNGLDVLDADKMQKVEGKGNSLPPPPGGPWDDDDSENSNGGSSGGGGGSGG